MTKALVIWADKTIEEVEIGNYKDGQAIVGGLIQPVDLTFGTMYVNEEFLYVCDEFNSIASDVAGLGGRADLMLGGIKGDVYLVGPFNMEEGCDTDLSVAGQRAVKLVADEA